MKNNQQTSGRDKPMNVYLLGLNHHTAPVTIREKVAINADRLEESLQLLRQYIPNGIILSTCNRTEIYAAGSQPSEEAILNFINALTGVSFVDLLPHIYLRENGTAFKHLFRIASGLDSMIIGEFEVLGQIKTALTAAENANMVTPALKNIFQSALRAGRQVREETGISRSALSVSSVAVDLAAKAIGGLDNCKMVVIGAGEAGRLVAKVAKESGVSEIVIASRTMESASALVEMVGGKPIDLDNMGEELSTANIVVACAGAPHRILDIDRVEEVMKNRPDSPLVIIDIAVPRNVEPEVGKIDNVFLYDIDDLTRVSEQNRQMRENEVEKAEQIVAAEVARCTFGWSASGTKPVITALMQKAEDIRTQQLKRTLKKLPPLSEEELFNLDAMTKSIVTKILQEPIEYLKKNETDGDQAGLVSELFRLKIDENEG
ncbi:MAG: glutamyl-tRNA reductase [Chloroflexi bacterium RBG_16_51_9]|nr:MAG: glutamyl-tRNA reductase [Chloroflexi bacterium RBG_16_51_9]